MLKEEIKYKAFSERAILIEWPELIDEKLSKIIIQYSQLIREKLNSEIDDLIIGYNSITIIYKSDIDNYSEKIFALKNIIDHNKLNSNYTNYLWEIPVCYDEEFGLDIITLSEEKNISIESLISQHTSPSYLVHFIGFLPGFMYLGGLHPDLHVERKSNPRIRVPKGSVAIGGQQTGIYPQDSAGGWHIIGRTPIDLFSISRNPPCEIQPLDRIKFVSVSKAMYNSIAEDYVAGHYVISKSEIC